MTSEDVGGGEDTVRLSITIDKSLRRLVRIAAAYRDMEISEWCAEVLRREAEKVTGADRGLEPS